MSIYRSTNPADFNAIDGIVVDESAPPPAIQGVGTGTAILVGQFERGPVGVLTPIGSQGELQSLFGADQTRSGNIALANKQFAALNIIRAAAAAAAAATLAIETAGSVHVLTFNALYPGAYGNNIQVAIAAGSTQGSKYTITDTNTTAVNPAETYDNVLITQISTLQPFAASKLISVTVVATSAEPATQSATSLASGSEGSIADTDYQTGITASQIEGAGDILFLDVYNSTRNGYLTTSAAATQDKMVVMAGAIGDSVSTAVSAVGSLRDSDGRLIYAYNWVQTVINGVLTFTSPASWLASLISQTAPNVDPAFAGNTQYLAGVTGLYNSLQRSDYISLKNAGICAFEYDGDIGFKVKSGVVTQIADSSKLLILRRRMADFLTKSIARFLKAYQNDVNSQDNRNGVKGAILQFVQAQQTLKVLPKDSEVKNGKASLVDTDSLNTDSTIAQGYFYVLYKQRIYSSMRYIVLMAEIGESVVVTEQAA